MSGEYLGHVFKCFHERILIKSKQWFVDVFELGEHEWQLVRDEVADEGFQLWLHPGRVSCYHYCNVWVWQ